MQLYKNMNKLDNLLLIGGNARNVGKTTFICDILKTFSHNNDIVAIKTSCHFHGISPTDIIIANNEEFVIVKETVTNTGKDSARMLASGAKEVFFIQAKDKYVEKAFNFIIDYLKNTPLIICESAALRMFLIPHFFITLVTSKYIEIPTNKLVLKKADLFIENYLESDKKVESYISIKNNKWDYSYITPK